MSAQWHFDPESYLQMIRSEVPSYDRLQQVVADATVTGPTRERVLDLGSGTGVTAAAVLGRHPGAMLVGIDSSEEMLNHARNLVPEATFVVGRLEDPLHDDAFDLVVSAFAVHHLEPAAKARLFAEISTALVPQGRFVLCDVVVPIHDVQRPVPLEPGVDRPSTVEHQLNWMRAVDLEPEVLFAENDLAVIAADRT